MLWRCFRGPSGGAPVQQPTGYRDSFLRPSFKEAKQKSGTHFWWCSLLFGPTLKPGNQTTVSGAPIRNCRSTGTKQGFFLVSESHSGGSQQTCFLVALSLKRQQTP